MDSDAAKVSHKGPEKCFPEREVPKFAGPCSAARYRTVINPAAMTLLQIAAYATYTFPSVRLLAAWHKTSKLNHPSCLFLAAANACM